MIHRILLLTAAALAAFSDSARAQVSYTGAPYTQSFDSLAGTTNNQLNVPWSDNATLPGWYASKSTYNVTDGTIGGSAAAFDDTDGAPATNVNNVGLLSFGAAGASERALGARATSNWPGNSPVQFGVRFVNASGQTLTRVSVAYRGEQWFRSSANAAHALTVEYQVGAPGLTGGTWTSVPALTFTAPILATTAATLDGNASANRRALAAMITGLDWAPGQELWIRFTDTNETGSEQGLSVDDFTFWDGANTALHFDGRGSYVTMGAATSALGASNLTLECWFLRTGAGATTSTGTGGVTAVPLVTKGRGEADGDNRDCNYFLGLDTTGRLVADFEAAPAPGITAGQNYPVTGATQTQAGVWYHAAATYDRASATWALYLNGMLDATFTNPANAAPRADSIQHFALGTALTSTGAAAGFFEGVLDEVRVWNVARTGAEISESKDTQIGTAAPGLRARYGLDEGSGTSAGGLVSGSPAGTLTGGPRWVSGAMFTPNTPPTVALISPADGGSAEAPATILLAAEADDLDGTISKVEFFAGAIRLGEDPTAPYELTITAVPQGTYSFRATAIDNLGGIATSGTVTFTVTPSSNPAPSIAPTSPPDNATGVARPVTLQVSVSDPGNEPLTVKFYGRRATPAPGSDFTLVTLPDTQFYSENIGGQRLAQFISQTNWIVSQQDALNIAFVSHMGDMVQNGDAFQQEWINADRAMDIVEQHAATLIAHGIPWGGAPGNHDTTPIGNPAGTSTYWNQYFGAARWSGRPYFRGRFSLADNNNSYQFFSASGLDFMIVHLAYRASGNQAILDWADALLKAHPHRRAIVTSHWIINTGNPASFGGQGQAIYENLKDNPNLFLLLCGHVHGEGRRTDTFGGRAVHSVLQDYQDRPDGAGGGGSWLRYFVFSPANNTILARTYRTTTGQFETDADSQFTLGYDMQAPREDWVELDTQDLAGGVTSASFSWPGLDSGRQLEWYAVVSDGITAVSTAARRFTTAVNPAPTVALLSPANNESFSAPATINFSASATDTNGSIARVEFFEGNNKLGEDTTAPYEFSWTGVGTGTYALTAVAIDDEDATALSNVVTVNVGNLPPVTIVATDDTATESGPTTGQFTVMRTGSTASPLTVSFTHATGAGYATNGVDYVNIGNSVTIPAGAAGAGILLTPLDDLQPEGPESVTIMLTPGGGYVVGSPASATVTILDDDVSLNPPFGLYLRGGSYFTNYRGQQEKYFGGISSRNGYSDAAGYWYYMLPNGDLYEFTPPYSSSALTGVLVARLGPAYYNNPGWLTYSLYQRDGSYFTNYRGQQEKYFGGTASANGYNDPSGYWYFILPNGGLYEFTPPYSNPELTGLLIARLGTALYDYPRLVPPRLHQHHGGYFTGLRGQQEKYLRGLSSASGYDDPTGYWYYLLPNGGLYEFTPPYSNPALSGVLVEQLGPAFYNDPSPLLTSGVQIPTGDE